MKNTLTDLNNYLFEALERINDDSLSEENLEKEIKRADATNKVAKTIIDNAQVQLQAMKHMQQARKVPMRTMTTPRRALIRTKAIRYLTGTANRFTRRLRSSRTRCALKLRT